MGTVDRIRGGCSNVNVRHADTRYRVCIYRTTLGWGGFVESPRYLEGHTGSHRSARAAWLAALRIMAGVTS